MEQVAGGGYLCWVSFTNSTQIHTFMYLSTPPPPPPSYATWSPQQVLMDTYPQGLTMCLSVWGHKSIRLLCWSFEASVLWLVLQIYGSESWAFAVISLHQVGLHRNSLWKYEMVGLWHHSYFSQLVKLSPTVYPPSTVPWNHWHMCPFLPH